MDQAVAVDTVSWSILMRWWLLFILQLNTLERRSETQAGAARRARKAESSLARQMSPEKIRRAALESRSGRDK